jgi:protein involved in polysaccharide export with SLBB domain
MFGGSGLGLDMRLKYVLNLIQISSIVFFVFACGGAQESSSVEAVMAGPVSSPDTTLGFGDLFDVRVYGEKELSGTFRIASDGTIDYPLIGTIKVEGMTPTEVVSLIETGLKEGKFLNNPNASILVKEYKSKSISVFGQVKKPGTFPYHDGMDVVEAISLAGGFTSMARKNDTTLIREINGEKKRFKVPVEKIGQGKSQNIPVNSGDIIWVPERVF